jgi:hypothetical protein
MRIRAGLRLSAALERGLQIELLLLDAAVGQLLLGEEVHAFDHGHGLGPAVGLHHARHHVDPFGLADAGLLEHGVGLADARGHAEEDLQPRPLLAGLLLLDVLQEVVWVGSLDFHPNRLPQSACTSRRFVGAGCPNGPARRGVRMPTWRRPGRG